MKTQDFKKSFHKFLIHYLGSKITHGASSRIFIYSDKIYFFFHMSALPRQVFKILDSLIPVMSRFLQVGQEL